MREGKINRLEWSFAPKKLIFGKENPRIRICKAYFSEEGSELVLLAAAVGEAGAGRLGVPLVLPYLGLTVMSDIIR